MQRGNQTIIENITASNTSSVPTGGTIPSSGVIVLVENIEELALYIELTDGGSADVDIKVHVKPKGVTWHEAETFALENLENETGDRYIPIFSDAWLYDAVFVEVIVNSGTASVDVEAIYKYRG